MSRGLNPAVLTRLWKLISGISTGATRTDLKNNYSDERIFTADIGRLKSLGIPLRYKRSTDIYELEWPTELLSLRLSPEEFFYFFYTLAVLEKEDKIFSELKNKLTTAVLPESNPVHDCGPAYGITKNINNLGNDLFINLADAIRTRHKVAFVYQKPNGEAQLREVHPYKLLHTPISWYLAGWCADSKDWRNFKLARMSMPKVLGDTFPHREFNIDDLLGDAWWVQCDREKLSNPYEVKVLFKGETAQSIREYKFHKTQTHEITPSGTLVTWHLSYLNEFASWLMQWLGNIEILSPQELINNISVRLNGTAN